MPPTLKLGNFGIGLRSEGLEQVELIFDGRQLAHPGGDLVEPLP